MTSRPLLTSVAELTEITGPIDQVGWASACSGVTSREPLGRPAAERAARRGQHEAAYLVGAASAQALRQRRVLAVDGHDLAGRREPRDERAADDEGLLVGERERVAGLERGQRRPQPHGPGDAVEDDVAGAARGLGRGLLAQAGVRRGELGHLLLEQLRVGPARGQADDAEPVGVVAHQVEGLGPDRPGRPQHHHVTSLHGHIVSEADPRFLPGGCREPSSRSVPALNATTMGRLAPRRTTMAKYLLLKHYRGAPAAVNDVPMDQWTPEEITAHIQFMSDFATRLEGTGEFVDGQALAPEGSWVRYDGEGRPPVTDGPFAETKDLIAGWMIIDVDTHERALELAGELSAAPGAGGKPIHEWLEVRPFLHAPADHRGVTADVDEVLLRSLTPARPRHPRPPRSRLRGGRGRRAGRAGRGGPHLGRRPAPRPAGLAGHRGLAAVPRRDPVGDRPSPAGGPRRRRAGARARRRRSTTRSSSTSCAPTPRSPRPPPWP